MARISFLRDERKKEIRSEIFISRMKISGFRIINQSGVQLRTIDPGANSTRPLNARRSETHDRGTEIRNGHQRHAWYLFVLVALPAHKRAVP